MFLLFKHFATFEPHLICIIHQIVFFNFFSEGTDHPLVLKDPVIQTFGSEGLLIFVIDHSNIDAEDKGREEVTLITMSIDVRVFNEFIDILIKLCSYLSEGVYTVDME